MSINQWKHDIWKKRYYKKVINENYTNFSVQSSNKLIITFYFHKPQHLSFKRYHSFLNQKEKTFQPKVLPLKKIIHNEKEKKKEKEKKGSTGFTQTVLYLNVEFAAKSICFTTRYLNSMALWSSITTYNQSKPRRWRKKV